MLLQSCCIVLCDLIQVFYFEIIMYCHIVLESDSEDFIKLDYNDSYYKVFSVKILIKDFII